MNLDRIIDTLKKEKLASPESTVETMEWGRPHKDTECPDGYKGRMGIHEVLEMSEAIKEMVVKNATSDDIERQAKQEGMLSMIEEGFIRSTQKMTSIEEVLRVTTE